MDYQKKQHYVDCEIDKDVKYFKSMSRGYATIVNEIKKNDDK